MTSTRVNQIAVAAALLAGAVLIAIRHALVQERSFAGPADLSFYFTLAKGLASGQGLSIPYIWHFFHPWNTVVHPGNDYWQPLAALIWAAGFKLTGTVSLHSALVMSGLAWGLVGALVFAVCGRVSLSVAERAWAAILALSIPYAFEHSMLTDTAIFAGLFGSAAIACAVLTMDNPRWMVAALVAAALSYLVRPDGILVLSAIAVTTLMSRTPIRTRVAWLSFGALAFVACCVPMWIVNHRTIGTLMPVTSAMTAFQTYYEQLYAYQDIPTMQAFLAAGPSITVITKLKTLVVEFFQLPAILGWGVLTAMAILAVTLREGLTSLPWFVRAAAVVAATQFVFYAFVATFMALPGAFARSLNSVLPFVAVAIAYGVSRTVRPVPMRIAILAALVTFNIASSVPAAHRRFAVMDARAREFALAGDWLRSQRLESGGPLVVMTREPWEFTELTGVPSVQIPSDGLDAICRVARKFDVAVILVPAPERPELQDAVTNADPRFSVMGGVSGTSFAFVRISNRCRA